MNELKTIRADFWLRVFEKHADFNLLTGVKVAAEIADQWLALFDERFPEEKLQLATDTRLVTPEHRSEQLKPLTGQEAEEWFVNIKKEVDAAKEKSAQASKMFSDAEKSGLTSWL